MIGQEFGEWTVIGNETVKKGWNRYIHCQCSCGHEQLIEIRVLKRGKSKRCFSCGHLVQRDKITRHGEASRKTQSRLYNVWRNMLSRVRNENRKDYSSYGGRGIEVTSEWVRYEIFRDWAMENGYKEDLQIDRINNDGGYSPDNCRFVTHKENMGNTRRTLKNAKRYN